MAVVETLIQIKGCYKNERKPKELCVVYDSPALRGALVRHVWPEGQIISPCGTRASRQAGLGSAAHKKYSKESDLLAVGDLF